ncbi:hypothetical protein GE061_008194 [Apolygus lucorum]|uniref:Uncharacterized protein n=1 Tax=Apolygus lucorum TaxID=248454 RepID=A0A6A4IU95_APOLU|nr:hypothetical protein GE061_008194 [Apolygus lucorum]
MGTCNLPMLCFFFVLFVELATSISHEEAVKITDQIEEILESPAADEIMRGLARMVNDRQIPMDGTDFWVKQLMFRLRDIKKGLDQYETGRLEETFKRVVNNTTETGNEAQGGEHYKEGSSTSSKRRVWRRPLSMKGMIKKKENYEKFLRSAKKP